MPGTFLEHFLFARHNESGLLVNSLRSLNYIRNYGRIMVRFLELYRAGYGFSSIKQYKFLTIASSFNLLSPEYLNCLLL